jgi:tRNA pseudouridine38-40 synthase
MMLILDGAYGPVFNLRYKAHISYFGANYSGWQRQPNAHTVQEEVETALSTYLRIETPVTGCGRTDAGVHASDYVLHFDTDKELTEKNIKGMNALLPDAISINKIEGVTDDFHARFHCTSRSYIYYLHRKKNPFLIGRSYHFKQFDHINQERLQEAATLIKSYSDFFPFCKTKSDVDNYTCSNFSNQWEWQKETAVYKVSANRFLRGMVRLLVGAQLNIGLGKLTLDELRLSMESQTRLKSDWSVPAHGLFLNEMTY